MRNVSQQKVRVMDAIIARWQQPSIAVIIDSGFRVMMHGCRSVGQDSFINTRLAYQLPSFVGEKIDANAMRSNWAIAVRSLPYRA